MMLKESPDGLTGTCVYKPHLFSERTIDRLLHDFQSVLECMTIRPDQPISGIRVSPNEQTSHA
jgi:hypothetical protein